MHSAKPPFHLAFPVQEIESTRAFYADLLGCPVGRESTRWIDFNFFGHQITAHVSEDSDTAATNPVDGDDVPVRHFGVILSMEQWQVLSDKLKAAGVGFIIEPHIRFKGEPGEQATMFLQDPSANALEFKAFADQEMIFSRNSD